MNRRIASLLVLLVSGFVALLLIVVLPASRVRAPTASLEGASSAPILTDMRSIDDLKAQFNRDVGTPRLVLLLSPT